MVSEISDIRISVNIRKYPWLFGVRYPKLSKIQIFLAYFAFLKCNISISVEYNVKFSSQKLWMCNKKLKPIYVVCTYLSNLFTTLNKNIYHKILICWLQMLFGLFKWGLQTTFSIYEISEYSIRYPWHISEISASPNIRPFDHH